MASFIINTTVINNAGIGQVLAANENLIVGLNGTVGSTVNTAITAAGGNYLQIYGQVLSAFDTFTLTGSDSSVYIAAGAIVSSARNSSNNGNIFYVGGANSSLVNYGEIISHHSIGVLSANVDFSFENFGSVVASSGVFIGLFGALGNSFTNYGTIKSNSYDDLLANTRFNNGVFSEGGNTTIINKVGGYIEATGSTGAGIRLANAANGSAVNNAGTINSINAFGIDFSLVNAANNATLINTGTITGKLGSYIGNDEGNSVVNKGTMNGSVFMGAGADTYDGRTTGKVVGTVLGEAGDDKLFGGTSVDTLSGGTNNDLLIGGLGKDKLNGGTGIDKFQFNAVAEAGDIITSFDSADFFVFKKAAFGNLTVGTLSAAAFHVNDTGLAHDASDRFIYEADADRLWYDSNGNAAGGTKIMVADLTNNFALSNADILIIA